MFFRKRQHDLTDACWAGLRNDLNQIGANADICGEISSIRQRHQFERIAANRHMARDIGLIK